MTRWLEKAQNYAQEIRLETAAYLIEEVLLRINRWSA